MKVGEVWQNKQTKALVEIMEIQGESIWFMFLDGDRYTDEKNNYKVYPPSERATFVKLWRKYSEGR